MKTFHIDCELDYDVQQQSLFVFNLGVPSTPTQRVIAESVSTTPASPLDEFRDESGHNRFFRVDVPPDQINIRYLATVEVQAPDFDVLAPETPLAKVPGEVRSRSALQLCRAQVRQPAAGIPARAIDLPLGQGKCRLPACLMEPW